MFTSEVCRSASVGNANGTAGKDVSPNLAGVTVKAISPPNRSATTRTYVVYPCKTSSRPPRPLFQTAVATGRDTTINWSDCRPVLEGHGSSGNHSRGAIFRDVRGIADNVPIINTTHAMLIV